MFQQGSLGPETEPREGTGAPGEQPALSCESQEHGREPPEVSSVAVIKPRWGQEIFYTRVGDPGSGVKGQNENAQESSVGWYVA